MIGWKSITSSFLTLAAGCTLAQAQTSPTLTQKPPVLPASAVTYVKVPGMPFTALPSADGQWIFASLLSGKTGGLALLHLDGAVWSLKRTVNFAGGLIGLALTHDGKTLLATSDDALVAFDVQRLIDGTADPKIGECDSKGAGALNVVVTSDDRLAFVSNESKGTVSVIDLARALKEGFSQADILGNVTVGRAPVGLALSPDDKILYSTSQRAPADYHWPQLYVREGNLKDKHLIAAGMLAAIDVHLAATDPAHALVQKSPAGSSPVRVALSPDGSRAYVSVRGSDAVDAFDSAAILSAPEHALLNQITVGPAPVGIAVSTDGRFLFAANSDRFNFKKPHCSISVLDAAHLEGGVIMTIPTGEFPREIRTTADGRALIVANFSSETVEIVDITSLPASGSGRAVLGR